ncbi:MAG TPA: hypothetical protein VJB97_02785, partial [Candidatus Paceibacterota bacterium]
VEIGLPLGEPIEPYRTALVEQGQDLAEPQPVVPVERGADLPPPEKGWLESTRDTITRGAENLSERFTGLFGGTDSATKALTEPALGLSDGASIALEPSSEVAKPTRPQVEVEQFVLKEQETLMTKLNAERDAVEKQILSYGVDYVPPISPESMDPKVVLESKLQDIDSQILASQSAFTDYLDGKEGPVKDAAERYRTNSGEGTLSSAFGALKDAGTAGTSAFGRTWNEYRNTFSELRSEIAGTVTGEKEFDAGRLTSLSGQTITSIGKVSLYSVPGLLGLVTEETAGAIQNVGNATGMIGFEQDPKAEIVKALDPVGTTKKLTYDAAVLATTFTIPGIGSLTEGPLLRGVARGTQEIFESGAIAARGAIDDVGRIAATDVRSVPALVDDAPRLTTIVDSPPPSLFDDAIRAPTRVADDVPVAPA